VPPGEPTAKWTVIKGEFMLTGYFCSN